MEYTACSIFVDGTNVSSAFVARTVPPIAMANGNGYVFRVNNMQTVELGTAGVHTIRAVLPLTNGWVVRDTATIATF